MSARVRTAIGVLLAGALVTLGLGWAGREGSSASRASRAPAAPSAAPNRPQPEVLPASIDASRGAGRLDAVASLRELEALSHTDQARALQQALDVDRQLPARGVMAEARRALIVTLLVDLNRLAEARARARSFGAEYPTSRYLPLVQGMSGVHPRPRPSQLRDARPPR